MDCFRWLNRIKRTPNGEYYCDITDEELVGMIEHYIKEAQKMQHLAEESIKMLENRTCHITQQFNDLRGKMPASATKNMEE